MQARSHATRASDRETPSDAPCPGIGGLVSLHACPDRLTGTRIGEGTLDWLKAGELAGRTAKQAEIEVGEMPKTLSSRRAVPADLLSMGGGYSCFSVNKAGSITE